MSPEQASGKSALVDGRSDIFSLGVVLYEMLTGRLPFTGNAQQILAQITQRDAKPPRQVDETIPIELEAICLKALARNPRERYSTAADLARDLRDWLARENQAAPAPSQPSQPRLAWFAGGSAVLVLATSIAAFAFLFGRTEIAQKQDVVIPSSLPKVEDFRILHYFKDPGTGKGAVRQFPDKSPIRVAFGDGIRIEVRLSEPAYAFLFALDADGKAALRYPKMDEGASRPDKVVDFRYPTDSNLKYTLNDGEGMQGFLLVASRDWPADLEAWKTEVAGHWAWCPADQQDWLFDGGGFYRTDLPSRGTEQPIEGIPAPFRAVVDTFHLPGNTLYGIVFPVEKSQ